jgi:hypothetical protein
VLTLAENLKRHRSKERAAFEDELKQNERAAQLVPVITAQAEQNQRLAAIQEAEKEAYLDGKPDPGWITPPEAKVSMPATKAFEFSVSEARKFFNSAEWQPYESQENRKQIAAYLERNGITVIVPESCFVQALRRLLLFGLLQLVENLPELERPEEPIEQPDPEELKRQAQEKYYNEIVGTDPMTLQQFTAYQLDRCDAETWRRVNRIPRAPNTYRPTVGETLATNR